MISVSAKAVMSSAPSMFGSRTGVVSCQARAKAHQRVNRKPFKSSAPLMQSVNHPINIPVIIGLFSVGWFVGCRPFFLTTLRLWMSL